MDSSESAYSRGSFEEFVTLTAQSMLRTATLLTGSRDAAEDLVQATYTHAFARWRQVRRADNVAAYTRTMLTRIFLAQQRRKKLPQAPWGRVEEVSDASSDPTVRLSLLQAISTLSATDRAILVLRYFHDLPVAEVANELGISQGACRTRASRALAQLRLRFPDLTD